MSIDELFKALENELNKKGKPLFGGGTSEGLRILSQLRSVVTRELEASNKVNAARGEILKSADESAKKIIDEAIKKSDDMLMRSDHVQNAQLKADEIMKAAVERQSEIMRNFAVYLDSKLCECEKTLTTMAEELRNDRAKLFPEF